MNSIRFIVSRVWDSIEDMRMVFRELGKAGELSLREQRVRYREWTLGRRRLGTLLTLSKHRRPKPPACMDCL